MPILQKLTKGSFVIIYCQDSNFQVYPRIGLIPIDLPPIENFDYSAPECFVDPAFLNSIKMMFGRSA